MIDFYFQSMCVLLPFGIHKAIHTSHKIPLREVPTGVVQGRNENHAVSAYGR